MQRAEQLKEENHHKNAIRAELGGVAQFIPNVLEGDQIEEGAPRAATTSNPMIFGFAKALADAKNPKPDGTKLFQDSLKRIENEDNPPYNPQPQSTPRIIKPKVVRPVVVNSEASYLQGVVQSDSSLESSGAEQSFQQMILDEKRLFKQRCEEGRRTIELEEMERKMELTAKQRDREFRKREIEEDKQWEWDRMVAREASENGKDAEALPEAVKR